MEAEQRKTRTVFLDEDEHRAPYWSLICSKRLKAGACKPANFNVVFIFMWGIKEILNNIF